MRGSNQSETQNVSRFVKRKRGRNWKEKRRKTNLRRVPNHAADWPAELPKNIRLLERISNEVNPLLPCVKSKVVAREFKTVSKLDKYHRKFDHHAESKFWGFPVTFSVVPDQIEIEAAAEREALRLRRKEMKLQDAESEQLRKHTNEEDRVMFLLLVERWGALRGDIYCTTSQPGKGYLKLAIASSKVLQRWWRASWHCVAVRRAEAASFLQRLYVRTTNRVDARKERKAIQMMRRIRQSFAAKCLRTWRSFASRKIQVRVILQRKSESLVERTFKDWKWVVNRINERKIEVQEQTLRKFIFHRSHRVFQAWKEFTEKMEEIRMSASVYMTSTLRMRFEQWREYCAIYFKYRKSIVRNNVSFTSSDIDEAATAIQCMARVWISKKIMQRCIRATDRKRVFVMSRRDHLSQLEIDRQKREDVEVHFAIEQSDDMLMIELESKQGKRKLRECTLAFVAENEFRGNHLPRGIALRRMVVKDMQLKRRLIAEQQARQRFRLREPLIFE